MFRTLAMKAVIFFLLCLFVVTEVHAQQRLSYEEIVQQVITLYKQGRYEEAIPWAEKALKTARQEMGENHHALSLNYLALLYQSMGRYVEAEPLYLQTVEIVKEQLGEDHPFYAASLHNLASLYESMGRYAEAEPLYLQAIEIDKEQLGEDPR